MEICIYCLQEKSLKDFNKEHVIPRSFGMFKGALTLVDIVCENCNDSFGKNIDLFLARDSLEGFLRHNNGIKKEPDPKLNYHRTVVKVEEAGDWRGAYLSVRRSEDLEQLLVEPIDQAGFRKQGCDEWVFFPLDDVPSKRDLENRGLEVKGPKSVKILFDPSGDEDTAVRTLRECGLNIEQGSRQEIEWSHTGGTIEIGVFALIDSWIARAIAKITFNYLTATAGKSFTLNEGFDEVREFIRYGKGEWRQFVEVSQAPILKEEQMYRMMQTLGHLIFSDWKGNSTVFSRVSLFNSQKYTVTLCNNFKGVWRPIACGHHYDVEKFEVSRLQNVRSSLMP